MEGLELFRQGALSQAVPLLEVSVKRDQADWVSLQFLGGAYGMMARKLAHAGEENQGAFALKRAVNFFAKAEHAYRDIGPRKVSEFPQLKFAQPRTLILRGWGDALNWLNRTSDATKVFQLGVQEGLWRNRWCRPEYERVTLSLPQEFFVYETDLFGHIAKPVNLALESVQKEFAAVFSRRQEHAQDWRLEAAGLHAERSWSQLDIMVNGEIEANAWEAWPRTCRALEALPSLHLRNGQVKISVMDPGTYVKVRRNPDTYVSTNNR
jgi:hypothetical protein